MLIYGKCEFLSCRCCMFVTCVHHVAVLNAAFCITYSLLMLVEDARGDHMEDAYSICLPHPGAVSAFMICRDLCVCVY